MHAEWWYSQYFLRLKKNFYSASAVHRSHQYPLFNHILTGHGIILAEGFAYREKWRISSRDLVVTIWKHSLSAFLSTSLPYNKSNNFALKKQYVVCVLERDWREWENGKKVLG